MMIEDIDFEELATKVAELSRKSPGTPDIFDLIIKALELPDSMESRDLSHNCVLVLVELGYGISDLLPWN